MDAQFVRKQTNESVDSEKKTSTDHRRLHLKICDKNIQTFFSSDDCHTISENVTVSSMQCCKSADISEIPAYTNLDDGGGINPGVVMTFLMVMMIVNVVMKEG